MYAIIETMTKIRVMVFLLITGVLLAFPQGGRAAFDCLTLTTSSAQSDKDFCRSELAEIEAQLNELLAKQADQKKTTGTIKGDQTILTARLTGSKPKSNAPPFS